MIYSDYEKIIKIKYKNYKQEKIRSLPGIKSELLLIEYQN